MNFLSQTRNFKILERINEKARTKRLISFILGSFIIAISYNLFLAPNNLVAGGVSGIAIILKGLFGFDDFIVILVSNIILLIMSYFLLGKEKTKASVLGSLFFPICVKLTASIGQIIDIDTSQILISAVFGGVVYGIGIGMIFKAGFTSGGTDILNQIFNKYFKMSIGKSMLCTDGVITLLSAFVFGTNKLMYSIIVLYIISMMSDRVILGVSDSKAFYIITDEDKAIKEYILKYLNHGVTVFNAKGGYAKEKQNVLMCVLPTKDYYRLKEGIMEIDPEAFFVVTDAYEVFGGE
ncbi:MAG: YitT family protein [bacterium]|nr:YitT family protein [bacterium]